MAHLDEKPSRNIELIGLPGVGKSYLIGELLNRFSHLNPYVLPNTPASFRERLHDYPFYLRNLRLVIEARKQSQKWRIYTCLKRLARRPPYVDKHSHRILVDCGLLQPLLELVMFWDIQDTPLDWARLIMQIKRPHHYLLITDTPDRIIEREINRSARQFPFKGKELSRRYAIGEAFINTLRLHLPITELHIPRFATENDLVLSLSQTVDHTVQQWRLRH